MARETHSLQDELPAHSVWVRRLARSLVRDEASADDAAQDAALAALSHPREAHAALGPWLARVTRNLARRSWRAEARRRAREHAAARPEAVPAVDETSARLEEERHLVEALSRLEGSLRHALVRRYLDGWSAARIARETGEPAATVRWRLQRGLAQMRTHLNQRAGGDGVRWRLALLPLCRGVPWPTLEQALPQGGTVISIGVMSMKATTQALGLAAALCAVGLGVWWKLEPAAALRAPALVESGELAPPKLEGMMEDVPPPVVATARDAAQRTTSERTLPMARAAEPPSAETRVAGRCLDSDLRPLSGVAVAELGAAAGARATSARDGRFELPLERGERSDCVLRFELEHKATRFVSVSARRGENKELGDIVLEPGDVLRGLVLGPRDEPFAGAEVRVTGPNIGMSIENARVAGPGPVHSPVATSGPDGRFEVRGVPLTPVRAWAGAEGLRYAVSRPFSVLELAEELVLVLEPLERDDRITGRVLTSDGTPVANAPLMVTASSGAGMSMGGTNALADGSFEIETQVGSVYTLVASDPQLRFADAELHELAPGTHGVELRFRPAVHTEVFVRDAAGQPIESFLTVAGSPDTGSNLGNGGLAEEHPGGSAQVLVPVAEFVVLVDARGYAPARQGPFSPEHPPARLEFELELAPGVRGRVLDGTEPLAGARVALYRAAPGMYVHAQGFEGSQDPSPEDRATTDAEGHFMLQLHDRGTYVVRAEAEGRAPQDSGPLAFDPALGYGGLELVLGPGGALEGSVLVAAGRDVEGIIVGVNRGDSHPRTVRTDADGRYRFEGLMPGAWQLARATREFNPRGLGGSYSTRPGWTLATNCVVRAGETTRFDLDLRSWVPSELSGTLRVNGVAAKDWTVQAWPKGVRAYSGTLPSTALDASGHFRLTFDDASPRRLAFALAPELGVEGTIELEVEMRGGIDEWSYDLTAGSARGRTSPPPAGEQLALCGTNPSYWIALRPDAAGDFYLPIVPAGPAVVRRTFERNGQFHEEILLETEVRAGMEQVLDLP